MAEPTPSSATPTVPMVESELPSASETSEHSRSAVTRKKQRETIAQPVSHTIVGITPPATHSGDENADGQNDEQGRHGGRDGVCECPRASRCQVKPVRRPHQGRQPGRQQQRHVGLEPSPTVNETTSASRARKMRSETANPTGFGCLSSVFIDTTSRIALRPLPLPVWGGRGRKARLFQFEGREPHSFARPSGISCTVCHTRSNT